MKDKILITGGSPLFGEIYTQTSKNATLPIIAGSVLLDGSIKLNNIPNLLDIENMLKILQDLGVKITKTNNYIELNSKEINKFTIDAELTKSIRSSIFMLGPMIARFKKVTISYPGGCDIGNRPIDLHLAGLKELGVQITERHSLIICDGKNMRSGIVHLDFPSVGATENIMMSAVFLSGTTRIINSAKEPEIVDLQNFLNKMGCKISGAGSSEIIVEGVNSLHSIEYTPVGDRIVAGTYLIGCAMCGGKIKIDNINSSHIMPLISKLKLAGCEIDKQENSVIIKSDGNLNSIELIETRVHPGFPTDLQAQIMAMQSVSNGVSVIVENIFENRYRHANELIKMGANIIIKDRVAVVHGVENLIGAPVDASDLRGGASLVLAGLKAKGYTTINNIYHIQRGYENIEEGFSNLGANIKLIE